MLNKTDAIILHPFKYSESSVVLHTFSRERGRLNLIFKGGLRKKKGGVKALLQPATLVSMEFYFKENRDLQVLKTISAARVFTTIPFVISKTSIALFTSEIMYHYLRHQGPHAELYDYIEDFLTDLDACRESCSNFHLLFLVRLAGYLGFEPNNNYSPQNPFFNIENAEFAAAKYQDDSNPGPEISLALHNLLDKRSHSNKIQISSLMRTKLLEYLLKYYYFHMGHHNIKSFDVLKEVFG